MINMRRGSPDGLPLRFDTQASAEIRNANSLLFIFQLNLIFNSWRDIESSFIHFNQRFLVAKYFQISIRNSHTC